MYWHHWWIQIYWTLYWHHWCILTDWTLCTGTTDVYSQTGHYVLAPLMCTARLDTMYWHHWCVQPDWTLYTGTTDVYSQTGQYILAPLMYTDRLDINHLYHCSILTDQTQEISDECTAMCTKKSYITSCIISWIIKWFYNSKYICVIWWVCKYLNKTHIHTNISLWCTLYTAWLYPCDAPCILTSQHSSDSPFSTRWMLHDYLYVLAPAYQVDGLKGFRSY